MKALKWLDKNTEVLLLSLFTIAIVVIMTAQICCRKIFGVSLPWSEELCGHLFIFIAYVGLAYSIRFGNAIRFDMILTFVSDRAKALFTIVADLIMLVFFIYLIPASFKVAAAMANTKVATLPYSMDFIYGLVAVFTLLIVVRLVEGLIRNLIRLKTAGNPDAEHKEEGNGA